MISCLRRSQAFIRTTLFRIETATHFTILIKNNFDQESARKKIETALKKNFYWQSNFKDSSTPEENTYIAYFGEDIDTAVQVASYILATVYKIPLDTIFTYKFDTIQ